jgi:hypothetical protein
MRCGMGRSHPLRPEEIASSPTEPPVFVALG